MNKKETTLLILIIIAVTVVLLYKFYKTNSFKIDKRYAQITESYELMFDNIIKNKTYEEKKKDLLYEINNLKLLREITQEEIINILDEAFDWCNIKPSKIEFLEVHNLNQRSEEYNKSEVNMQGLVVKVNFTSHIDKIVLFIDRIQNNDTEIAITDLEIVNNVGGEIIHCTINLSFYVFPLMG